MTAAYRRRLARRARILEPSRRIGRANPSRSTKKKKYCWRTTRASDRALSLSGPRSFEPGEGEIFFGRDDDVEAVRNFLAKDRVVAVLGGSGSGKSSLLRAGLLPFLNTRRRIEGASAIGTGRNFVRAPKPLDELASALAEQLMLPLLRRGIEKVGALGWGSGDEPPLTVDVDGDRRPTDWRKHIHDRFRDAADGRHKRRTPGGRPRRYSPTSPNVNSTAQTTS